MTAVLTAIGAAAALIFALRLTWRAVQNASPTGGLSRSLRSNEGPPDTVLIARMRDGSYLLQAWPQMVPNAYLTARDARELEAGIEEAFGKPKLVKPSGSTMRPAPGRDDGAVR